MTKKYLAQELVRCPAWSGNRSVDFLVKNYTKEELADAVDQIGDAMQDYYSN